jgi:hypothetical protein
VVVGQDAHVHIGKMLHPLAVAKKIPMVPSAHIAEPHCCRAPSTKIMFFKALTAGFSGKRPYSYLLLSAGQERSGSSTA